MEKKKICIIGAGPAGIQALKHFTRKPDQYDVVAFDRNFFPGGTWAYTDKVGSDEFGVPIHSSMYNKLQVNIPKEIMELSGFPYPEEWPSYITRHQVLQHLNNYIDHYGIRQHIKTHTLVEEANPMPTLKGKPTKWKVTYSDIRFRDKSQTETFDAVLVCIGHDSNSYVPDIEGKDLFQGRLLHSHGYRDAEEFDGLTVAILGASFSGEDIGLQVAQTAKKFYICHDRSNFPESYPQMVDRRPPIVRMTKDSIIFRDGEEVKVDAVIFCTGYRYSFPFFKTGIIQINNERVTPIFKHIIHIDYPESLFFFNIPRQWVYFRHFGEIAKLAMAVIEGKANLPSREDMARDSDEDYKMRLGLGFKPTYAHIMNSHELQWKLNQDIAKLGGFEPIPHVFSKLWTDSLTNRHLNITFFHDYQYTITGENSYQLTTMKK